jgi:hypothetical protein
MKMDNETILEMALQHAHKRLSQLEKQCKGLEQDDVAQKTVFQFCKERGLELTHLQRIRLGTMARNLSNVAGRPVEHAKAKYEKSATSKFEGTSKVSLHTERALERCAESMGFLNA